MDPERRRELKRRCREKGAQARSGKTSGGPQLAQRLKDDPTSAMMELGIDDPNILQSAASIVNNPNQILSMLRENAAASREGPVVEEQPDGSDDEEAPPPVH